MNPTNPTPPPTADPAVASSALLGDLESAIGRLRQTYSLHWQSLTGDQIADMDCAIEAIQNVIDTVRNHSPNH